MKTGSRTVLEAVVFRDGDSTGLDSPHRAGWSIPLFVLTCVALFLGMSRVPNFYDEGIVLTAAMRLLAGQVPHRDFYANYGPAEYYSFALLFKLFGQSMLAERLWDIFLEAVTVVAVYRIAGAFCRGFLAFPAALVAVLWLQGIGLAMPYAIVPVGAVSLGASALLVPAFTSTISRRSLFIAGALAGLAGLYRYDSGIALLGIHGCLLGLAGGTAPEAGALRVRRVAALLWPYVLGFAVLVLPPLLYFLSVSSIQPFLDDILVYPGKYYAHARNLPFPGVHLRSLDDLGVYLPVLVVALSCWALLVRSGGAGLMRESIAGLDISKADRARAQIRGTHEIEERQWQAFLLVFGLLTLVLYFKGIVRVSLVQMYLSILPSTLLLAVLIEKRAHFPRLLRAAVVGISCLSVFLAAFACVRMTRQEATQRTVPGRLLRVTFFRHRSSPGTQATWCSVPNPMTRGFCFLPDDGRVNAIEFILSHTRPEQTLYVGLSRHDKVFANDNILYFATQRMPATRWSHFDPDIQNRLDVQTTMVHDLEANKPPYVVLDSELETMNEPNDSAKSSGVFLLDNYLHHAYHAIEVFDEMAIWQRNP